MTTPSADDASAFEAIAGKDDRRTGRLSNRLESRLDEEWKKAAYVSCDDSVRAFWVCRQDAGLLTPFNCRAQNDAMNTCLNTFARNAVAYEEFKRRRAGEIKVARDAALAAAARVRTQGATGGDSVAR